MQTAHKLLNAATDYRLVNYVLCVFAVIVAIGLTLIAGILYLVVNGFATFFVLVVVLVAIAFAVDQYDRATFMVQA